MYQLTCDKLENVPNLKTALVTLAKRFPNVAGIAEDVRLPGGKYEYGVSFSFSGPPACIFKLQQSINAMLQRNKIRVLGSIHCHPEHEMYRMVPPSSEKSTKSLTSLRHSTGSLVQKTLHKIIQPIQALRSAKSCGPKVFFEFAPQLLRNEVKIKRHGGRPINVLTVTAGTELSFTDVVSKMEQSLRLHFSLNDEEHVVAFGVCGILYTLATDQVILRTDIEYDVYTSYDLKLLQQRYGNIETANKAIGIVTEGSSVKDDSGSAGMQMVSRLLKDLEKIRMITDQLQEEARRRIDEALQMKSECLAILRAAEAKPNASRDKSPIGVS